jgi:hypothetical protein
MRGVHGYSGTPLPKKLGSRTDAGVRVVDRVSEEASKMPTDVTEHVVRELALPTGLVDNKVCAIERSAVAGPRSAPEGSAKCGSTRRGPGYGS